MSTTAGEQSERGALVVITVCLLMLVAPTGLQVFGLAILGVAVLVTRPIRMEGARRS